MSRGKKSLLNLSEKKNQNKTRYDDKNKQNSKNLTPQGEISMGYENKLIELW